MDAAAWDKKYEESELVWGAPPNELLVEYATALPHGQALDLACGEGRNALWLATRGWEVTGVDYSAVAIEKARTIAARSPRSVLDRLDYRCGDVTVADYAPGNGQAYDLTLLLYLHLPAPQRTLVVNRAINSLKPDGILMILGHDRSNIDYGVGGPQDPEILYTPEELMQEFRGQLEFEIAGNPHRHTETGIAIDALVIGRKSGVGNAKNG
ncbi:MULTISPECIES: class I SAM-dependent methyltransferase [Rhodococcus]|uniref:class I SAM-dependent methyltransferase n=1 Tax=Rhodococcus TaxID=1827 RepID=UPI001E56855F|nr:MULTISPECIES: class I SAM-dependent methyltransferase [Rhodococcus]MCD2106210.1 class I SAM-dependent methyltransferase [Rhodococcus qingshengii]MCZ4524634.1 class I SAM-dependent methyltransferase [Rhodococcus erythropolis]MDV8008027.1 class I SAM-dependent methyltransferase [Rhodococcus sp. IEGM 1318]